jgi:hypothetical protein
VSAAFEASAPCRIDLADGPRAVSVAVDRRAWCRVETGAEGLAVESKDTLQRVQVARASELDRAAGPVALVREALRALGVESGLRVSTQARVPASSGLGSDAALAVALVGGLARAAGRELDATDTMRLAARVVAEALERPAGAADVFAARHGGCVALGPAGAPLPLRVDPAAVEECLLLVDTAGGRAPDADEAAPVPHVADSEALGERVRLALTSRRFEDLARTLDASWDARCRIAGWETAERRRIGALLRPAGAGLRACGEGRGSVLAIVSPPGERGPGAREAVVQAAGAAAGLRLFRPRVDLLGLDVEKTG